jgi:hypothetical protein
MLETGDLDLGAPVLEVETTVVVDDQKYFMAP